MTPREIESGVPEEKSRASHAKVRSELAAVCRYDPGNDAVIGRLRQEYKASRCAEHLKKVVESFPPLTPSQVADLQAILAGRAAKAPAGSSAVNARPAGRSDVAGNGSKRPNPAAGEYRGHGRTQWDAMTEAVSGGRYQATKLALLMFVRYGPWTGAGLALAYTLIAVVGQHR